MNPEIAKWVEEAESSRHYNGKTHSTWENRFLELYKELERANKIIDKMLE